MSITAVLMVSGVSAGLAAFYSAQSLKDGSASIAELSLFAFIAICIGLLVTFGYVMWSSLMEADLCKLLLPDLTANRPGRAMFLPYCLVSAGVSTAIVATLGRLFVPRMQL